MIILALAIAAQDMQVSNDPFDPYVAVLTTLPTSAVKQSGSRAVVPLVYVSTFRVRKTGQIQEYVKLEIEYISDGPAISVDSAQFAGGEVADFEVISAEESCLPTIGMCKTKEVLSVRLPPKRAGAVQMQFRNRTGSWRGTVSVPESVFQANLKELAKLK